MTNPQTPENAAQGADWLDEAFEKLEIASTMSADDDGRYWIEGIADAKAAIEAKIAAEYVPLAEHEQAMEDQLATQKAMFTEAEVAEREVAARNDQTFKVIQSLVKAGSISDQVASTTIALFTAAQKAKEV